MTEFEKLCNKLSSIEIYLSVTGDRETVAWHGYNQLADIRDFQWQLMRLECPDLSESSLLDEIFGPCSCGECDDSWFEEEGWAE